MDYKLMYCRVIRLKGDPSKTEEAIKGWINGILPALKQQPGFAGATLAGNRTTGEGLGVSYFESEKTMIDARDRVRPEAMKVMDAVGSTIVEEDTCEVAVSERFKPAKSGAFVRVTTVQADPAHIAEGIKYFQEKVVPSLRTQPGVRGAFSFVNRESGKTFAGSWWDSQADLDNSESAIRDLREDTIKKIGGKASKVEAFEVYYTEILAPAFAGR